MNIFHTIGLPEVDYWVGATDEGHEGVWLWVDGSVVEMGTPFWAIGCHDNQLPDGGTYENCAVLSKAYSLYFDDVSCDGIAYAICEL